jgi:hypothetical protein
LPWSVRHEAGSPDSSEQRAIAFLLERLDSLIWKSSTRSFKRVEPSIEFNKTELKLQRGWESFQNSPTSGNNFAANAVSCNKA